MMTRLVMYIEVEADTLTANPLLPEVLQLRAKDEVPPGYRLGQRSVTYSDNGPPYKVVCWPLEPLS